MEEKSCEMNYDCLSNHSSRGHTDEKDKITCRSYLSIRLVMTGENRQITQIEERGMKSLPQIYTHGDFGRVIS